ncbi:DUF4112 domain-containing protein [Aliiroseovarius subalbicans]|uniref:DUF4112 domain-containing protein n=1 Tax=Aliiroseovarius subalbicans TaxID=2925840 RepID=UPI001F5852C6|nr:DUF4112 domain-containing protein [Aliiroseovarius subalbicans]MCI2398172.1 DUF4112 domain-containing protein [Aliiroseovarius subalbicans]
MDVNIEARLQALEKLAYRLENLVPIPGTDLRFGIDAMLGFVPVVGDFAALIPGAYIVKNAYDMGASRRMLIRMALNLGIDVVIGLVPAIGDLFDIAWNANTRNVALLRAFLETKTAHAEWARAAISSDPAPVSGAAGAV